MAAAFVAMFHRRLLGLLASFGLTLAGCQATDTVQAPAVDVASARRAVRSADSVYAAAVTARDLDGSVASHGADAIMFPPDEPPVIGRAAIREFMRQHYAIPNFSVTWTTDTVVVAASGDMAYSFARRRITVRSRSGTAGMVDTAYGKGVSVWRRDPDGRWRAVADIWNGAPTLPAIHPVGSPD